VSVNRLRRVIAALALTLAALTLLVAVNELADRQPRGTWHAPADSGR
jgi:hypothetical protein